MPQNPFESHAQWKVVKQKYGIPDNVIKGGKFGVKMEGLKTKFDKLGLKVITKPKVPVAQELVKEANKLFNEWLTAADKLKPEKFKDKNGAINKVKMYQKWVKDLENNIATVKDYFAGPRANYSKCVDLYKTAVSDPSVSKALQELYSQGIRNHLGAKFHEGVTQYKGEEDVINLLKSYEQLAAKWNDLQKTGTEGLAKDKVKRVEFLKDMQECIKIGTKILDLTKP